MGLSCILLCLNSSQIDKLKPEVGLNNFLVDEHLEFARFIENSCTLIYQSTNDVTLQKLQERDLGKVS